MCLVAFLDGWRDNLSILDAETNYNRQKITFQLYKNNDINYITLNTIHPQSLNQLSLAFLKVQIKNQIIQKQIKIIVKSLNQLKNRQHKKWLNNPILFELN